MSSSLSRTHENTNPKNSYKLRKLNTRTRSSNKQTHLRSLISQPNQTTNKPSSIPQPYQQQQTQLPPKFEQTQNIIGKPSTSPDFNKLKIPKPIHNHDTHNLFLPLATTTINRFTTTSTTTDLYFFHREKPTPKLKW